jgi:hypothetical protein
MSFRLPQKPIVVIQARYPKVKKQCEALRVYANAEKILYVCKAVKPTNYTTEKEFALTYYHDYATFEV